MTIRLTDELAYLQDECGTDDADPLLEWFREHHQGEVDLKDCRALHTAVLQVLLAAGARVSEPPADEALARWLLAALGKGKGDASLLMS